MSATVDKPSKRKGRPKGSPQVGGCLGATKYNPVIHDPAAEEYGRLGATLTALARGFDLSLSGFKLWLKKYPDLKAAFLRGKAEFDTDEVEKCLKKKATGYYCTETKSRPRKDDPSKFTIVEVTKRHIPADTTAQIFWLKNRREAMWRDKQHVENVHRFRDLSDEELDRKLHELRAEEQKIHAAVTAGDQGAGTSDTFSQTMEEEEGEA